MKYFLYLLVSCDLLLIACSDKSINIFTLEDDIAFGKQLDSMILSNPAEYPILPRSSNLQAYQYLESMMNQVLSSEEISNKDNFPWKVTIINSEIYNAFAAPGGKLYFYKGIMKYLDKSSQLAGVMAHEIAHSDRRHSTKQMSKAYGLNILLGIVLGNNPSQLEQIVADLASNAAILKFSRSDEYEADECSVRYLNETDKYNPIGIAGFFEKLKQDAYIDENGNNSETNVFEFLSTHPSDEHRLENINDVWTGLGSPAGSLSESLDLSEYTAFKLLIP